MHIQMVTFTMPIENKENFQKKLNTDKEEAKKSGSLSREIWMNETKKEIEYTIVTKWNTKKDFQNWIGREEHLEHHRKMAQYYKDHPEAVRPKIDKKMKSFTLYENGF